METEQVKATEIKEQVQAQTQIQIPIPKPNDKFYRILMLKSELFDIIKEQEQCMSRFNQLNDLKSKKIQELQLLEGQ